MLTITSAQNPRIRQTLALHEGRERRRLGLYLIEGIREIERLLLAAKSVKLSPAHPEGLLELYVCQSATRCPEKMVFLDKNRAFIQQIIEVPDALFEKISLRQSPDGFLGVAKQKQIQWKDLDLSSPLRLVVAEAVEKPGNLGALLRVADAVGARALILCERAIEIWNPNVIRASMGSFFHVPTLEMSSQDWLEHAQNAQIQLICASPHASSLYTEIEYSERVALIVGAEDRGLSEFWSKSQAQQVRLPMLGMADSLNVSTAAAVCLYEILRQHQFKSWI